MQIQELGYRILQTESVVLPNGMDGKLLLLMHAPIRLRIAETDGLAQTGDLILCSAKMPIQFEPAELDMCYDWMLFGLGSDATFYQSLQIPENVLLRFADASFLHVLMGQICAEFYAGHPKRSDMLDCLLKALLIRVAETAGPVNAAHQQRSSDPHYQDLVQLREKIYANPQEKWTVEMLCSEVNMSRSYFQLVYRETFGMTCIADVINCKMNRARELLTATSYTISHIAQLCGYDNEEHFMRQFKKNNGVTPTVYRREHRV